MIDDPEVQESPSSVDLIESVLTYNHKRATFRNRMLAGIVAALLFTNIYSALATHDLLEQIAHNHATSSATVCAIARQIHVSNPNIERYCEGKS